MGAWGRGLQLSAAILILLGGACIDDPVGADDQLALSQEDAELLGLTIWRQALATLLDFDQGSPAPAPDGAGLARESFPVTDTTFVACALGGGIQQVLVATVTFDTETDEFLLEAEQTLVHDECREAFDGQTFTFYGAPSLGVGVRDDRAAGGRRFISGSLDGSVLVITEGLPLVCDVSVAAGPGEVLEGTVTYPLRGSFCGAEVDQIVTESLD